MVINWLNEKGEEILQFLWQIVIALLIIWIGRKLIRWISKLLKRAFEKTKLEAGMAGFLLKLCQIGMYLLLVMAVTEVVGIGASSVIAIVGSCGVTIGLALQGSLSNLAGGVLILTNKPFVEGDYILVGDDAGTVVQVDLIYTTLQAPDGHRLTIPNGTLSNSVIQNMTTMPVRRIDETIAVAYQSDMEEVKRILADAAKEDPYVLKDQEILVFINSFQGSGVEVTLRCWVKKENFLNATYRLREEMKAALQKNGIEIPYSKLDVSLVNEGWQKARD